MEKNNLPYAELKGLTFGIVGNANPEKSCLEHMVDVWNEVRVGVGTWDGTPQDFMRMIIGEHCEVPEFIQMSWILHNVSRAFCAQLERGRLSSYWERSLRAYDCSGFASRKEYQPFPEDMDCKVDASIGQFSDEYDTTTKDIYENAMHDSDHAYQKLIKAGVPVEMARGVLPLHIQTKVWWRVDLRNFYQKIKSRTCYLAQREYWHPLIMSMKEELTKVDSVFQELFRPPCKGKDDEWQACIMPADCIGRLEGEIKMDPCPLFENTPDYKEYKDKKND